MRATRIATGVVCLASIAFGQGSLTPPGAPSGTMKTLQQVEPRIDLATVAGLQITQSGSYYLSDNLVVSNSIGISIGASDVTLDLNGFKILHAGGQSGKAIYVSATRNITIKNGSIQEFEDGVYMYGSDGLYPTQGARLENLNISRCTGYGLFVGSMSKVINCHFTEVRGAAAVFAAANSSIQNCTTDNSSGGHGFQLLSGARVFNCSAVNSGTDGFDLGANSILQNCISQSSTSNGFLIAENSSLSHCKASDSANIGFSLLSGAKAVDCNAINSGADGFKAESNSAFQACSATGNSENGFDLSSNAKVIKCTAVYNEGYGFFLGNSSIVRECMARENFGGIYAGSDSIVQDCIARNNEWAGIKIINNCILRSSVCEGNSHRGILVDGSRCVVENCTVSENKEDGILIWGGDRNRIIGNHCCGNKDGIDYVNVPHDNFLDGNTVMNNSGYGICFINGVVVRNTAIGNGTNYNLTGGHAGSIETSPSGAGATDNFSY